MLMNWHGAVSGRNHLCVRVACFESLGWQLQRNQLCSKNYLLLQCRQLILCCFQVPEGLSVILYDQNEFKGESITFTGPQKISCLVSAGWNDRARSMKIIEEST
jgi:hypothetical protein